MKLHSFQFHKKYSVYWAEIIHNTKRYWLYHVAFMCGFE